LKRCAGTPPLSRFCDLAGGILATRPFVEKGDKLTRRTAGIAARNRLPNQLSGGSAPRAVEVKPSRFAELFGPPVVDDIGKGRDSLLIWNSSIPLPVRRPHPRILVSPFLRLPAAKKPPPWKASFMPQVRFTSILSPKAAPGKAGMRCQGVSERPSQDMLRSPQGPPRSDATRPRASPEPKGRLKISRPRFSVPSKPPSQLGDRSPRGSPDGRPRLNLPNRLSA
jgi:hypothetical protein